MSTIRALNDSAHPPRRRPWLIALSSALPAPLLLGLRLIARRRRRSVLTAAGLMIAVAMVVAAITVQHELQVTNQRSAPSGLFVSSGVGATANHLLIMLSVILVVLAAISATFIAWSNRDRSADLDRPCARLRRHAPTDQRRTYNRSAGPRARCGLPRHPRGGPAVQAGRWPPFGGPAADPLAARGNPRHPDRGRIGHSNPSPDRRPTLRRRGVAGRIARLTRRGHNPIGLPGTCAEQVPAPDCREYRALRPRKCSARMSASTLDCRRPVG